MKFLDVQFLLNILSKGTILKNCSCNVYKSHLKNLPSAMKQMSPPYLAIN